MKTKKTPTRKYDITNVILTQGKKTKTFNSVAAAANFLGTSTNYLRFRETASTTHNAKGWHVEFVREERRTK